jgi:hypothetical protein
MNKKTDSANKQRKPPANTYELAHASSNLMEESVGSPYYASSVIELGDNPWLLLVYHVAHLLQRALAP